MVFYGQYNVGKTAPVNAYHKHSVLGTSDRLTQGFVGEGCSAVCVGLRAQRSEGDLTEENAPRTCSVTHGITLPVLLKK